MANTQSSFAAIDQNGDELPGDTFNRDRLDGFRGTLETKGEFSAGSWWKYGWDVTLESDDTFRRFYKLDNVLLTDRVNRAYLEGISDRSYLGLNLYHFGGLLIDDTSESESRVHPIIDHNYVFDDPLFGGELRIDSNVLSFQRTDVTGLNVQDDRKRDQNLTRVVTEVKWRRRLTDAIGISYTPFAELRGDVYQYNNYVDPQTSELVADEIDHPWLGHGRDHHFIPLGCQYRWRKPCDRTHRPDHYAPEQRAAARPSERGRQEPRVRRYEPVRDDEILRP